MIQDIYPHKYDNSYMHRRDPRPEDYVLFARKGKEMLACRHETGLEFPTVSMELSRNLTYAFSIDDKAFFMGEGEPEAEGYSYISQAEFRVLEPKWMAFAGITGMQLARWMRSQRFCSRCGKPMRPSDLERAYCCDSCGMIVYPKISPACIVGLTDGERILVTRYADRPNVHLALVAGFNEIGETMEETVQREVMEEVGLKVKNIRYYKDQPWSFSDTLLFGYYAELDGSPEVTLDTSELKEAVWMNREDLPVRAGEPSLTAEMMEMFRIGKI